MTTQNSSPNAVGPNSFSSIKVDDDPMSFPLSELDIEFIEKQRKKAFKITRFFVVAFSIVGIVWALESGYYEPLFLATGAILLTLGIWLLVRKSYTKEFNLKQKMVYQGKVKKSTYTTGSGKSKVTHYQVKIGDNVLDNFNLYASFADDDEVEVHLSKIKKFILKKQIIKGSGNLEFNNVLKKDELPEDIENEDYLTDEEISVLQQKIKKNTTYFMYTLVIAPLAIIFMEWFFRYVDINYEPDRMTIRLVIVSILVLIFGIAYYFAAFRIVKDLKINKKKILQTIIIDKEQKSYSNTTYYVLKTKKKEFNVSYTGFSKFTNHEKIEVHLSAYRKMLIQVSSRDEKNKIYKNEIFFKNL